MQPHYPTHPDVTSSTVVTLAGDTDGPSNANTTRKLLNRTLDTTAPVDGQALIWNAASSKWVPTTIPGIPVVWRPGGAGADGTLDTWAQVMTRFAAMEPAIVDVYVDTSITDPAVIPAGAYDGAYRMRLRGVGSTSLVHFPTGATLKNLVAVLDNCIVDSSGNGAVLTFDALATGYPPVLEIGNRGGVVCLTGFGPTVRLAANQELVIHVHTGGFLSFLGGLAPTVALQAFSTCQVYLDDYSEIGEDTFSGPATASLIIRQSAESLYHDFQPSYAGATSVLPRGLATNIAYDPDELDDWPVTGSPGVVNVALDDLARRANQVILASLGPGGSISPNNFIGPYGGTSTGADVVGFFGVGYWAPEQDCTLKTFTTKVANVVAVPVDFHVYAGATPSTLAFTGIILTVAGSTYISTNTTDTLDLLAFECVAILNSDLAIGWTSGGMAVTALCTPKPL